MSNMPLFDYDTLREKQDCRVSGGLVDTVPVEPVTGRKAEQRQAGNVAGGKAIVRAELDRRIKTREVSVLTRQLAALLRAGLSLVPALGALEEQLAGDGLGQVVGEIRGRVNGGATLAGALAEHGEIFSALYVNMVGAGEASGTLEEVLSKLALTLEKRARLTGKVRAALAYPVVMAVAAVGVVMFLLAFVIPSLAKIFTEMNQELPGPTVLLLEVSGAVRSHVLWLGLGGAAVVFGWLRYVRSERGGLLWDRLKLRLPLVGDLGRKLEAARLTRTLGILLGAGVSVLEALRIAKGVVQNRFVARELDGVREAIGDGQTIAEAIRRTGLFAPIMYHTIRVGEMSGKLEEQLEQIAESYDEEVEQTVGGLVSLLEPAILLAMGVVVGLIVLAVLLPIFEINQMI